MNDNNPAPKKEADQKSKNLIMGILAIVVIILLFSWLDGDQPTNDQPTDETMDEMEETSEPSTMNFEGLSPEDWDLTERAERGIASLTSGQSIDFYVVEDPNEDDVVYFATHAYDDGDDLQMIGVYRYQTDNYNFERLFRRSYDKNDLEDVFSDSFPRFHVVGIDGDELILLVTAMDDSPGPCAEPLLLADNDGRVLWSMDIENPYGGFEEYTLPADIRSAAEEAQESCLAGM